MRRLGLSAQKYLIYFFPSQTRFPLAQPALPSYYVVMVLMNIRVSMAAVSVFGFCSLFMAVCHYATPSCLFLVFNPPFGRSFPPSATLSL